MVSKVPRPGRKATQKPGSLPEVIHAIRTHPRGPQCRRSGPRKREKLVFWCCVALMGIVFAYKWDVSPPWLNLSPTLKLKFKTAFSAKKTMAHTAPRLQLTDHRAQLPPRRSWSKLLNRTRWSFPLVALWFDECLRIFFGFWFGWWATYQWFESFCILIFLSKFKKDATTMPWWSDQSHQTADPSNWPVDALWNSRNCSPVFDRPNNWIRCHCMNILSSDLSGLSAICESNETVIDSSVPDSCYLYGRIT